MIYFKLAWKNIWRNRRRSLITITSILFAVFFTIFLRSMQLGMYAKMIDSVVRSYYGYVQIHQKGYWEEQSIENTFERDLKVEKKISSLNTIKTVVPRLEGFALCAVDDQVKGVSVCGTDPEIESKLSGLNDKIIQGEYLSGMGNNVLLGEGLAKQMKLKVGDSIVLISQGYHSVSASGKYLVKGILHLNSTQMNNNSLFMPLVTAQEFYSAPNRISSLALCTNEGTDINGILSQVMANLNGNRYEVMSWQEMLPELVQIIEADSGGGKIMVFILYMVISFGIFGTVVMMVAERKYEFGVLLSIGMSRMRLSAILVIESILIAMIGVVAGTFFSRPFMHYFHEHPITLTGKAADTLRTFGFEPQMPTLIDYSVPITHGTALLVIAFFLSFYSIISVWKLNPIKAAKR